MTTNLNTVAGPSQHLSPDSDAPSPASSVETSSDLKTISPSRLGGEVKFADHGMSNLNPAAAMMASGSGSGSGSASGGVSKPGLSVDENGEVIKVPAFLQKLFSMVADPTTDTLIYWADSGDSFFVPNHERFGKEILPRFFKHSNFSSFVRQLNMYGFHKVPQPQTGVLKQDNPNDSELWEFVNPFFKRGQPNLLSKVTRKNNRPGQPPLSTSTTGTRSSSRQAASSGSNQYSSVPLITDGTVEGEAGMLIGPNAQQMADLSAITAGIAAIRQTQASIGADLKALQTSNEHLWREAVEQRETSRKHEETITLIVSFLERLFGTEGEGLKGLKEAMRRGGLGSAARQREDSTDDSAVGKKRKRLGLDRMISDGRPEDGSRDAGQIVELPNENDQSKYGYSRQDRRATPNSGDQWSSNSQRFTTIPTDEPSSSSSRVPTPNDQGFSAGLGISPDTRNIDPNALVPYGYMNNGQNNGQNFNAGSYGNNNSNSNNNNNNNNNNPFANGGSTGNYGWNPNSTAIPQNGPLSPNSTAAAASAFNLDPALLQTSIGSLLQSPAAAQMFLSSLNNSVQGQALQSPRSGNFSHQQQQHHQQQQQQQPMANHLDPTLALFNPLNQQAGIAQNNEALMKSYQDAMGVNGEVDKLQESIEGLVRSMGLDVGAQGAQGMQGQQMDSNYAVNQNPEDTGIEGLDPDFNVDDFLESLAKENEEAAAGIKREQ